MERGLSPNTVAGYLSDLQFLAQWACGQGLPPAELHRDRVTAFLVTQQGAGRAARSMARMASALRQFLGFLRMEGEGAAGPEAVVRPPRPPRILPRALTEAQVEALLAAPDRSPPWGCGTGRGSNCSMPRASGVGAGRACPPGPCTWMKDF